MASQTESEFEDFDKSGSWNEVYQRLKNEASLTTLGDEFSVKVARDPENRRRNRYRDVSPYDHSRVELSGDQDYINASFVEVPEANRKYILTQGPLEHTMCDFWQMTWEQKSKAIVMLNRVIEKGALKCSQYWPLGFEDDMDFPECGLRVILKSEEDYQHFSLRSLELENMETGETRIVLHFHYTTWPDFGVPSSPDAFLQFLNCVRQTGSLAEDVGPAIVHCSAGIGRSGTFCLVDSSLVEAEKDRTIEKINVRENLIKMRSYRMGLIQTADQLRFSYLAIIQGAYAILKGSGLKNLESQNHLDVLNTLDDVPPPLPPKKSSKESVGDQETDEDISDEEFDGLVDRDEDENESEDEDEMVKMRHQIREERKKQTLNKMKEMKDKLRKSERWRPYKPYVKPMYVGLAVIVGIAGVVIYKYLL